MYNFENLRQNGKIALSEWHKKLYKYEDLICLIPQENNNMRVDYKSIEEAFYEIVVSMKNTPQDPTYHNEGDVWTHTKMVMDEMFDSEQYKNETLEGKQILFWSAFLHDVAKPITVEFDADKQRIANPFHSTKGAQDLRLFFWKNGFDRVMRENIARVIKYHQRPFHWHVNMSEFQLRLWSQEVHIDRLLAMARADIKGRISLHDDLKSKKRALENLELLEFMAIENNCLTKPWDHDFISCIARKIYFDSNAESHEDRPVFQEKSSDVIFLSGLPASGKDHWVKNFGEGRYVLSYDDERKRLKLKNGKDGQAVQAVKEKAKELLRRKEPFIFNATHINEELRSKNLSLLNQYGATIRIVHLETDPKELIYRNKNRVDSIPQDVIFRMARKWSPPSPIEGHEVMWWDSKKSEPVYHDFITTKKDEGKNCWNFKNK